ncbi:hypothetical protein GCM10007108_09660 [Thermogymnomonas acidicola]|uniref:Uncharacterized protein n=1 Tax=Thermogymnomonas acidicola TaxID=399579 RepID=A0AA37BRD4_9ARCH|nr:hypothetical protein [Thermogymnomonas acidicola]GGM73771.1 hypothetical protein GCM10007108_09660 [Thermogymnomonas acidicola]
MKGWLAAILAIVVVAVGIGIGHAAASAINYSSQQQVLNITAVSPTNITINSTDYKDTFNITVNFTTTDATVYIYDLPPAIEAQANGSGNFTVTQLINLTSSTSTTIYPKSSSVPLRAPDSYSYILTFSVNPEAYAFASNGTYNLTIVVENEYTNLNALTHVSLVVQK